MDIAIVSQVSGEVIEIFKNVRTPQDYNNTLAIYRNVGECISRKQFSERVLIAGFFVSPSYPIYWRELREGDKIQISAADKMQQLKEMAEAFGKSRPSFGGPEFGPDEAFTLPLASKRTLIPL